VVVLQIGPLIVEFDLYPHPAERLDEMGLILQHEAWGGRIARIALEHLDRDRAPLGRAQQPDDDLQDNNPAPMKIAMTKFGNSIVRRNDGIRVISSARHFRVITSCHWSRMDSIATGRRPSRRWWSHR
jgi:hypothetical protein